MPRLLRYRCDNRAHLAPWEPLRDASFYTLDHYVRTIAEGCEAARLDRGYPFVVLDPDETHILATFSLANVVRAFQGCHLGYGAAAGAQVQA